MDEEDWTVLHEYPKYDVSNFGNIMNNHTGRMMSQTLVGKAHRPYVRLRNLRNEPKLVPVNRLVAQAWVAQPKKELDLDFNIVVHRDGDLRNCHADNLAWRQRWWAMAYHKEMMTVHKDYTPGWPEILVLDNDHTYFGIAELAYGLCLLPSHILERLPGPGETGIVYPGGWSIEVNWEAPI